MYFLNCYLATDPPPPLNSTYPMSHSFIQYYMWIVLYSILPVNI